MSAPYSEDLRKKVFKYLEQNNNKAAASRLFNIGESTIQRWASQYKKLGHIKVGGGIKKENDNVQGEVFIEQKTKSEDGNSSFKLEGKVNSQGDVEAKASCEIEY